MMNSQSIPSALIERGRYSSRRGALQMHVSLKNFCRLNRCELNFRMRALINLLKVTLNYFKYFSKAQGCESNDNNNKKNTGILQFSTVMLQTD